MQCMFRQKMSRNTPKFGLTKDYNVMGGKELKRIVCRTGSSASKAVHIPTDDRQILARRILWDRERSSKGTPIII